MTILFNLKLKRLFIILHLWVPRRVHKNRFSSFQRQARYILLLNEHAYVYTVIVRLPDCWGPASSGIWGRWLSWHGHWSPFFRAREREERIQKWKAEAFIPHGNHLFQSATHYRVLQSSACTRFSSHMNFKAAFILHAYHIWSEKYLELSAGVVHEGSIQLCFVVIWERE